MAALTVCSSPQNCSDSGAQENKLCHRLHRSPRICHEVVALATKTSLQGPGWVSRAQVSTASGAGRAQRSEGAGVRGAAHSWGHSGGAQRPPPSPVGEGPTGGAASRRTFSPSAHSESSRCCPWGGRWGRGQGAQTADDGPSCEHHRGARGEDSGEGDKALRRWTTGPHVSIIGVPAGRTAGKGTRRSDCGQQALIVWMSEHHRGNSDGSNSQDGTETQALA